MDFNNKKNCIQDLKYILYTFLKFNNKKINNKKNCIQDHKYILYTFLKINYTFLKINNNLTIKINLNPSKNRKNPLLYLKIQLKFQLKIML